MPTSHAMRNCESTDKAAGVVVGHPSPRLAPFVELLWHDDRYRDLTHRERVLPASGFTLVCELASGISVVNGVRSKCVEFETRRVGTVVGVLFRPGGARAFFTGTAERLYNRSVPLQQLWGSDADDLCDRLRDRAEPSARLLLVEQALDSRLQDDATLHPAVACGLAEFRRVPHVNSVLEVTKQAGLSRRRFSQLFREQVGITPKRYCRVRRFAWVVEQLSSGHEIDWAGVAQVGGYSDQAHLVHEFQEFSGLSPAAFLKSDRSGAHVRVT
jgi:AraC-like DNA-binding protein